MTSRDAIDRHLGAVFGGLVTAVYLTKQMLWSVSAARRDRLQDMLGFLVEQSHLVDEAEARIGGRAAGMAAPSSHERRNLLDAVHNDVQAALAAYTEHVTDLASDIRKRAAEMGDADEAKLLADIAAGLQTRVATLERFG
jgi:hypothetical protein